jgi:hypothetical protein
MYGSRPSSPRRNGWKYCFLSTGFVIGLALIAIGIALPIVIKKAVTTGVTNTVILDPSKMTEESLATYINGTQFQDVYIWNCTNLYDVLTSGAKANFQEVGPITTIRHSLRYNVTWDNDNSKVSYKWLTTYEVVPNSQYLLDQTIIGPNPFYFGVGAKVMQAQMAQATCGAAAGTASCRATAQFPGKYISEQALTFGFLGGQVLPGVLNLFNNQTNLFLTGIRAAAIQFYAQTFVKFCTPPLNQVTTCDLAVAVGNWTAGTPYASTIQPLLWTGLELPATRFPSAFSCSTTPVVNGVCRPLAASDYGSLCCRNSPCQEPR